MKSHKSGDLVLMTVNKLSDENVLGAIKALEESKTYPYRVLFTNEDEYVYTEEEIRIMKDNLKRYMKRGRS